MTGLVCIGEPLVELRPAGTHLEVGVGGDMLNVAARAAARGLPACLLYVQARDGLAAWLSGQIAALGVQVCTRAGGGHTGLYSISTDRTGARSFSYWRDDSACAGLHADDLRLLPPGSAILLVSGITQALSASAEDAIDAAVTMAARAGMVVAYDPNVRPSLWNRRGGLRAARQATEHLLDRVDVFLPSLEDCEQLWGSHDPVDALPQVSRRAAHAIVKGGARGVWLHADNDWQHVPAPTVSRVVDTTGAGDAFDAAYLSGLAEGLTADASAEQAVAIAAESVAFPGALSDLQRSVATEALQMQPLREEPGTVLPAAEPGSG